MTKSLFKQSYDTSTEQYTVSTYLQSVTLAQNNQVQALISFLGPFIAVTTPLAGEQPPTSVHTGTLLKLFFLSPQRNNLLSGKVHRAYRGMFSLCGPHSETGMRSERRSGKRAANYRSRAGRGATVLSK